MNSTTYEYLASLLAQEQVRAFAEPATVIAPLTWPEAIAEQLTTTYKELGGLADWTRISVQLPEGLALNNLRLSIDNALHFNRYRAVSLRADFYEGSSLFNEASYRRLCRSEETACLKQGKPASRWTSVLAESHFGKPAAPGEFVNNGSPGWKLRAFQDMLSDAAAISGQARIYRMSVHDRVLFQGQLQALGTLLQSRTPEKQQMIKSYLFRQLHIGTPDTPENPPKDL